jgi:hypothetical protein
VVQRYQPDWLSLQEVADLVAPDDPSARRDICSALADRKLEVRALVEECVSFGVHDPISGGYWVGHRSIFVPRKLIPYDINWKISCPRWQWSVVADVSADPWHPRAIARLELRRTDVEKVFGVTSSCAKAPKMKPGDRTKPGPKPEAFARTRDKMLAALNGGLSVKKLSEMRQKVLAADFGASRETAVKARKAAIDSYSARVRSNSDNSDNSGNSDKAPKTGASR